MRKSKPDVKEGSREPPFLCLVYKKPTPFIALQMLKRGTETWITSFFFPTHRSPVYVSQPTHTNRPSFREERERQDN